MGTKESGQAVKPSHGDGVETGQVSVTGSATPILPFRENRRSAVIVSHGATDVFLGKSNVTATTGLKLPGALVLTTDAAIYGITAGGTQPVSFMELY